MSLKRLLLSLIIIGGVGVVVVNLSSAFFSDTETSVDNTFQAGELDLLVDGQNDPTAIVDVDDLKPGDDVFEDKLLTVQNNSFVWLHLIEYVSGQGTQTTPEEDEESQIGEKHDIENFIIYDLSVAGEEVITFDANTIFPSAFSCWIPLGEIESGETTVTQSFHFDEDVTNWAQGDTLSFSEEFYATQVRNNPSATPPDLGNDRSWNDEVKSCLHVDVECDLRGQYVIEYTCTSGCSGVYPHTMNINTMNFVTGDFWGDGFYNPTPAFTWDLTGNTTGSAITYTVVYTGLNPGYTVTATGTISGGGTFSGTASSNTGQTFTFASTSGSCSTLTPQKITFND